MTSTAHSLDYETETIREGRRQLLYNTNPDYWPKPEPYLDLQVWVWEVLGIWIPNHSICPGHTSPYKYFHDRYFETVLDTLLWAGRMCSKSFMAALECWLKARKKPGWEANICAGSGAQASRSYEATSLFWHRTDDIDGRLVLKRDPLKTVTEFINGAKYEITTSSEKSQRGPHPNNLFADEIDEMDRDVFNSAMQQTMEKGGYPASTALLSTMHKVGGLMGNWVDNAVLRGYGLYTFCVLETMEACTDDYSCDTCPVDEYCHGRLKLATKEAYKEQVDRGIICQGQKPLMGHNTIETIQRKVRQGYDEDDTGLVRPIDIPAELFCRRPSRIGLVFKDFNINWHVVPEQEISIQTEWKKGRTLDFGHTAPFIDLYFAITPKDQIIFYEEFWQTGMDMNQIIAHLKEGRKHTAFLRTFADPAGATEIASIKNAGIPCNEVVSEIKEGLDYMWHLLRQDVDSEPMFIISSACKNFIREMTKYKYPESGTSENPVKDDDHCVEAARRAIVAWRRGYLQSLNALLDGVKTGGKRDVTTTDTQRAFQESKQQARRVRRSRKRVEGTDSGPYRGR